MSILSYWVNGILDGVEDLNNITVADNIADNTTTLDGRLVFIFILFILNIILHLRW